jgi:hypothetical protein
MSKFNVVEYAVNDCGDDAKKIVKGGKDLSRTMATKMAQRLNEKVAADPASDNLDTIVSYQAVPA